jgi:ceramide glucosyltransferase
MTTLIWVAAGFCAFATVLHLASIAVAVFRCKPVPDLPAADDAPAVSLIRPVCGLDNYAEETLRSGFELAHPRYELILCAARADDAAVPLVRALMAEYRAVDARLLIGDERISANPKLNNVFKGWRAARHDWIVIADSNVLMPRDYIARLLASWKPRTGLVSAPPIGCLAEGFWAELECAFLNSYQARWQYLADTAGLGFAQGKTLFCRRAVIENGGGMRALGTQAAEDAAATKLVRAQGLRVRLADASFGQPLGCRSAREVWNRQVRWAQLRRASFVAYFLPELISGGAFPLAAGVAAAAAAGVPPLLAFVLLAALWYGAEILLVYYAGWQLSWRTPLAAALRDLMLPALWLNGWRMDGFVWRGNAMDAAASVRTL